MAKLKVSDEKLVKAWVSSQTIMECAEKLDLTRGALGSRVKKLRDAGVKLAQKDRATWERVIDTKGLNDIVAAAKKV